VEDAVGESIDGDLGFFARAQVSHVRFLRIGVDPGIAVVDHAQHRRAGGDKAARLDIVHLGRGAGDRRFQHGVVKIALRLIEHGAGLHERRILLDRQVRLAEELVEDVRALLHGEFRLQLRGDQPGIGVVEIRGGSRQTLGQRRLALDVALLDLDGLLRELDQSPECLQVALQLVEIDANGIKLALRLSEREAERRRIDLEQHVARGDMLAFLHDGAGDPAGHVGRDQHFLRADVGIVGGNITAAGEIEPKADQRRDRRHHHQKDEAKPPA
jgi:hypothetical protein